MIRDLAELEAAAGVTVEGADVCIVGAGIAGLVLADRLRGQGRRVVVLESGGRSHDERIHELNWVVQQDQAHLGATDGRFRGLGGTSTRWGGQLLPLTADDLGPRPHVGLPPWPLAVRELEAHLPEIERLFAVDDGAYDGQSGPRGLAGRLPVDDPDLALRFPKWPTFGRRNLVSLLRARIEGDPGLEIWLHATATGFEIDRATGRVTGVGARHLGGGQLLARARHVVIAAGTIESTRLLLLLDAAHEGRVFAGCAALGRYFQDHFSAPVARLAARDFRRLNRMFGQRFVGSTMRSLRLELRPAAQAAEAVSSAFGHVSAEAGDDSAFALLRDLLRERQERGRLRLRSVAQLASQLPALAETGLWRYGLKRLRWPPDARLHLRVDVEQLPHPDNRIMLSSECDCLGQRRAMIAWRVRAAEHRTFGAYARRFTAFWRRHGLDEVARIDWLIAAEAPGERIAELGRDTYHPTGSTRMGQDRRDAVVDPDLRTHALPNLWVASASVLPSSGSANPTLTLMLLARRLGDRLASSQP